MWRLQSYIDFFFMTVGLPSIPLFIGYILMIAASGLWQRWTKPLDLKTLLILHNFGCCMASVFTFLGFSSVLYSNGSLYGKTHNSFLLQIFKLYWITKVVELLDTVFMVLRHRRRQISFLHVYHHSSMLLLSDMAQLYYPWPSIATFLAVNSLVHIVLYLYYGLTALRPEDPPKWKKGVTQVQIGQFFIGLIIAGYGYQFHSFCIYSIVYGITMITLFSNFYYHSYMLKLPERARMKLK